MPILFVPGSSPPTPLTPAVIGTPVLVRQDQPTPLQITYIDPDGRLWFLSDPELTEGIICEEIVGISGIPNALSTIPLVRGGAIGQLNIPQVRQIVMSVFIMSTDNAAGQNDYLDTLDDFTLAFTNIRDNAPAPGTLIIGRPDGTARQCSVICTSGIDQPTDSSALSGLLFTSYVLTLQALDPYFYDTEPQELVFGSPISDAELASFDFEDGTDGWTASGTGSPTVVQSTDFASTGTHSLKLTGDGTNASPSAHSPMVAVSPGQSVSVTVDLFCNVSLTGSPDAQLGANFYDNSGSFVSSAFGTAFTMTASTKTTKTFTATVPADDSIGFLEFIFQITGTPPNTTHLYGDNIDIDNLVGILPLLPVVLNGSTSFGVADVVNGGTADSYPTWTITGPGTPTITNNTTGKSWTLANPLSNGQVVQVDTRPGQQSVIDTGTTANPWDQLVIDSPRDLWPLIRGDNQVNLEMSGPGPASEIDHGIHAKVAAVVTIVPAIGGAPTFLGSGLTGDVTAELFDHSLVSQGLLDITTMNATIFYNQVGSWACALPFEQGLWETIQSMLSAGGFEVVFNWGGITLGGRCENPGFQDSVPGVSSSAVFTVGPMIVLAGADFLALIANRLAYPNPAVTWASNLLTDHDDQSAVACETAIKHYVSVNVGASAITARKVPFLTVATNLARGGTVSYKAKLASGVDLSLMDVIRGLAAAGGPMGVRITLDRATPALDFDCYVPADLSKLAYFSKELGNLTSVGLQLQDATVTSALVFGSTALVEETDGSSNPWTRIEQLVDQSGSSDATQNAQAGTQAIAQGILSPTLSVTATDIPRLQYGVDYNLGDKVTVEIASGDAFSDIVTQVDFTYDASLSPPISVIPTIGVSSLPGAASTSLTEQLARRVRMLERKLNAKI